MIRARGVAAWMAVRDSLPPVTPPSRPAPAAADAAAGPAVTVLAAMTMAALAAG